MCASCLHCALALTECRANTSSNIHSQHIWLHPSLHIVECTVVSDEHCHTRQTPSGTKVILLQYSEPDWTWCCFIRLCSLTQISLFWYSTPATSKLKDQPSATNHTAVPCAIISCIVTSSSVWKLSHKGVLNIQHKTVVVLKDFKKNVCSR